MASMSRNKNGGHAQGVEVPLENGADVNSKDNRGLTALWLAEQKGHTDIIELLRKHGAEE